MKGLLQQAYDAKHTRRGRKSKLSVAEMLLLTLEYWRQYTTFEEIGFEFGVCESTANNIVIWAENVLIKSGKFSLPGRKNLLEKNDIEVILVDVTECPIERPKKTTKILLREKENTHNKSTNCCQ
jgi:hypothetical protein